MRPSYPILLAGAISAVALLGTGTPAVHARGSWACAASLYATCFSPSQVSRAERLMPAPPVDPSRAVFRATHLRLARVAITRPNFKLRPNAIFYSYGLPLALDQPLPRKAQKYVLVMESASRLVSFHGLVVNSTKFGSQVSGNFSHRSMSLIVYGNVSRQAVRSIGAALASS